MRTVYYVLQNIISGSKVPLIQFGGSLSKITIHIEAQISGPVGIEQNVLGAVSFKILNEELFSPIPTKNDKSALLQVIA